MHCFGTKKDKKDTLLFFSETMRIKPQNYLEAVYRMQKRQKHCFWYQNFSNLLQVQITYNARCLFEHENHNTSCKQCILVPRSNLYCCKNLYSTVFGTKKDQNCYGAVFISLYEHENYNTCCVQAVGFHVGQLTWIQKVQCSHLQIAKSSKHWIVLLAIACVLYSSMQSLTGSK